MCVAKSQKDARQGKGGTELKGSVLDVLRALLADGHDEEVLALVSKLVSRNEELEKMLARARESKNRGEHISKEQLELFLGKLREQAQGELADADRELQVAAEENGGRPERTAPPKQPAVRRPPPPGLRRIENLILVPKDERACPNCGKDRPSAARPLR
jgi:hypothetical protein